LAAEIGLDLAAESIYAIVAIVTGYNVAQGYADRGQQWALVARKDGGA
jgi:hypothetical protein